MKPATNPRRQIRDATASSGKSPDDDTLIRGLSHEDRARLAIDAWEPSLLKHMLRARHKASGRAAHEASDRSGGAAPARQDIRRR